MENNIRKTVITLYYDQSVAKSTVLTLGQQVKHQKFGVGKVVGVKKEENTPLTISVRFFENNEIRDLVYPHPTVEILSKDHAMTETKSISNAPKVERKTYIFDEIKAVRCQPRWVEQPYEGNLTLKRKLMVGHCYGTAAQNIFLKCCDVFGWDVTEKNKFGLMQILYAKGAAKGKSPWFLPRHHWIISSKEKEEKNWLNYIAEKVIYEEWKETNDVFYNDFSDRVTFAKSKKGYVYIGVFRSSKEDLFEELDPATGRVRHIKRYHLVQKDYEG